MCQLNRHKQYLILVYTYNVNIETMVIYTCIWLYLSFHSSMLTIQPTLGKLKNGRTFASS